MDWASLIPGLGGFFGSLLGGNGAQDESNRLKARQLDMQQQALTNYQKQSGVANSYREQGSPYLQKQGAAYGNLGQLGTTDRTNAQSLLDQFLPRYAGNAGVPLAGPNSTGVQFPGGNGNAAPTTGNLSVPDSAFSTPFNPAASQGPFNPNQPLPGSQGEYQTGQTPQEHNQAVANDKQANDPYGLSQPQQEQLNQKVDAINMQADSAIQDYRATLAQQGLPPNPAGEARIREGLGSLVNQEHTQAAMAAHQERQQALQSMINFALGEKDSGTNLLSQEAQGYGNVAQGYGQYANSAQGAAQDGPFLPIAAQLGQGSQFSQNGATGQYEALGQLIPIIAELFKGGGNKKTSEKSSASSGSLPTSSFNPFMTPDNMNLFP